MSSALPQKSHEYTNHVIIDSTRWNAYRHRPGDIIISTSYKTGTTWTQTIVANLLFQDGKLPAPVDALSPWLDMAIPPLDKVIEGLEAQTHQRFIKSHLALDGLPFFETARYIVVGRDLRDVFMSMWNHHNGYTDEMKANMQAGAKAKGGEFPDYPDLHAMFQDWIAKSPFPWESSGFPYWSHMHHVQTWWEYRHLPNVLMVHYTDMLADPGTEIRRIAQHIGVEIDEAQFPGILDRISFKSMKENFNMVMAGAEHLFRGGGQTFMNKGVNGRWQGVLTEAELAQCNAAVARELTPDCAAWLEHGGADRL